MWTQTKSKITTAMRQNLSKKHDHFAIWKIQWNPYKATTELCGLSRQWVWHDMEIEHDFVKIVPEKKRNLHVRVRLPWSLYTGVFWEHNPSTTYVLLAFCPPSWLFCLVENANDLICWRLVTKFSAHILTFDIIYLYIRCFAIENYSYLICFQFWADNMKNKYHAFMIPSDISHTMVTKYT